jgi:hypothetical protein
LSLPCHPVQHTNAQHLAFDSQKHRVAHVSLHCFPTMSKTTPRIVGLAIAATECARPWLLIGGVSVRAPKQAPVTTLLNPSRNMRRLGYGEADDGAPSMDVCQTMIKGMLLAGTTHWLFGGQQEAAADGEFVICWVNRNGCCIEAQQVYFHLTLALTWHVMAGALQGRSHGHHHAQLHTPPIAACA